MLSQYEKVTQEHLLNERLADLLRVAANGGDIEKLKELLNNPLYNIENFMNKGDTVHEYTALMRAAAKGHVECYELLLNKGVRYRQVTKKGNTALMIAALNDQDKIIDKFIEIKCSLSYIDDYGHSEFKTAFDNKQQKIITAFLKKGINLKYLYQIVIFIMVA